jgi:hypothetical protein
MTPDPTNSEGAPALSESEIIDCWAAIGTSVSTPPKIRKIIFATPAPFAKPSGCSGLSS